METRWGERYRSVCIEQILEAIMRDSESELSEISDYGVDFDHDDSDDANNTVKHCWR